MFCRHCGYCLHGLETARCPECGKAFDPANPKTYRRHPKRRAIWVWLRRAAVAITGLVLLIGMAVLWLYWDWKKDETFVREFRQRHEVHGNFGKVSVGPTGPDWLRRCLGNRWSYLLDRGVSYSDDSDVPFSDSELTEILLSRHVVNLTIEDEFRVDDNTMRKIGQCRHLRFLIVWNAQGVIIQGMQAIEGLSEMQSLDIMDGKNITSLSALHAMKQLTRINVSGSSVDDDGVAVVETLPNLTDLAINNSKVTDAGLIHIGRATKLEGLFCGGLPLSDAGIAHLATLTKLDHLYIPDAKLTPACLPSLKAMKSLYSVFLPANMYTAENLAELRTVSPKLRFGE